jgi:hypothetical protein
MTTKKMATLLSLVGGLVAAISLRWVPSYLPINGEVIDFLLGPESILITITTFLYTLLSLPLVIYSIEMKFLPRYVLSRDKLISVPLLTMPAVFILCFISGLIVLTITYYFQLWGMKIFWLVLTRTFSLEIAISVSAMVGGLTMEILREVFFPDQ